ncbi:MAG: MBL fold metallo-hydrolase [Anaerolineaceae bacterium]|nr:MBL fold metallo-hydrolase [Anaerolineaceae bacterium]
MRISYYGHCCTRLVQSGLPSVITDGYPAALGKRGGGKNMGAEIATFSAGRPKEKLPFRGLRNIIDGPGEYEIGGLFIHGLSLTPALGSDGQPAARNGYLFHENGITILHLGALTAPLPPDFLPYDEPITVLLLPLDGDLNEEETASLTNQLQPLFVVPMFSSAAVGQKMEASLKRFAAALGTNKPEPSPSLQLNAKTLDAEANTQLICLNPA